mmetsp:Transcript_12906/g.24341  ORF Transcript_12906/g.24341 Transcript_12906/m.24341 type:complete len:351 (-) Transcript_12906:351-1403(-)
MAVYCPQASRVGYGQWQRILIQCHVQKALVTTAAFTCGNSVGSSRALSCTSKMLLIEVLRDLGAGLGLRLSLPSLPGPLEAAVGQRQRRTGPEQRWPALVLQVPLVAPVADWLPGLEVRSKCLLHAAMNPHDECLLLRKGLVFAFVLNFIFVPTHIWLWNILGNSFDVTGIWLEHVLVARTLQIPQNSTGCISVSLLLCSMSLARKGMGDIQQLYFCKSLARVTFPPVAPANGRRAVPGKPLAKLFQELDLTSSFWQWVLVSRSCQLVQRNQRGPAAHEKAQGPLRSIALRELLGWSPDPDCVMRNSIQKKGTNGSELQRRPDHAIVIIPLKNSAVGRHRKNLGTLDELL